jgi:hypothetical protein
MTLHRNAKLGPGGRLALVTAIEGGMSLKAAAAAFRVSPAPRTAGGIAGAQRATRRGGRCAACTIARAACSARCASSSLPSRSGSVPVVGRPAGARGWSPPRQACALDRLEGAPAGWALASAAAAEAACQQLRVALPGRPAAHGPLCPLRAAGARPHRRSFPALAQLDAAREALRLRLRARDRRRPLATCLRRAIPTSGLRP